jgi:hypothetical protein
MNTMNAMTEMSMAEMQQRLDAVTRVHKALNARQQLTPMSRDVEAMLFMAGSFAVLCLMGLATFL